jgi:hypothetical protein
MPNWCSNTLSIKGNKSQLKSFLKKSEKIVDGEKEYFTFSGTYPEPDYNVTPVSLTYPSVLASFAKTEKERKKIMENKPIIRKDGWWDWRVQNWGTKWEPSYSDVHTIKDGVEILFDTAWGPPLGWLQKVSSDYPDLHFCLNYSEPGMCFAGTMEAHCREDILISKEWDVREEDDEFDDELVDPPTIEATLNLVKEQQEEEGEELKN